MKKSEIKNPLRISLIISFSILALISITKTVETSKEMEVQEESMSFEMEFLDWQRKNIEKSIKSHEAFLELEKEELDSNPQIKGAVKRSVKMLRYYQALIFEKHEYEKFLLKKGILSETVAYHALFATLSSVSMVMALLFAILTKPKRKSP